MFSALLGPRNGQLVEIAHVVAHQCAAHAPGFREECLVRCPAERRIDDMDGVYAMLTEGTDERDGHVLVKQKERAHEGLGPSVDREVGLNLIRVILPVAQRVVELCQRQLGI